MSQNNAHGYEFGPYQFDPGQRALTCAGEKVALTPKSNEILSLLVTNAGQLVERDALLSQVWPDTFVEEANLTQNIFLLRRALGDERRPTPKYIETVSRRGYRFVASVKVSGASEVTDGETVDGESVPPTVAVLPFTNVTQDPDAEYLADGLTENLVNSLCRVPKLRVMSRSAVFRYKQNELDPRVIGKELGVDVVVVSTITSRPPRILISVELVQVSSGWQLWGESFDGELKDLLELQDSITRQLLAALKLKLSGDEEKRVTARYTENASAYQSYLEGRYHWSQYTRKGIEKAIIHFRQAIELDPNYALSYAGIIDCYLRLTTNYLPPEEDVIRQEQTKRPSTKRASGKKRVDKDKKADSSLRQADPKMKLRFEWDWKVAEREVRRAHQLKSEYPSAHQWFAAYRLAKQLFEESTGAINKGDSLDSKLPIQVHSGDLTPGEQVQILCTVAREQISVGNFEAAELILREWNPKTHWPDLQALTPHAAADLLFTLGALLSYLLGTRRATTAKRAEAFLNGAIAIFRQLGSKSREVEAQVELGRCYYSQGLFDIARETFSLAVAECPEDEPEIKSHCLIFWSILERDSGRLLDSLDRLKTAIGLKSAGLLMKGRCDLELATTLKDLAIYERQNAYNHQAMLQYKAAHFEFEAVGHHRMAATAENNLGFLLLNLELADKAEEHLCRARRLFEALSDNLRHAQVNETLTRLYIATGKYSAAEETVEEAIQILEVLESEAILAEALTTSGIVLSRLGNYSNAKKRFEAACRVAERCGDREDARRALLGMFEELKDRLDRDELSQIAEKLKKLQSITEPSSVAFRVEMAIDEIELELKNTPKSD